MNNGGAETLAIRLADKLDKTKFDVYLCSLSDEGPLRKLIEKKKIKFFTLNTKGGKDVSLIYKLLKAVLKYKISIIHTHNHGPLLYTFLVRIFLKKIFHVHTEHINMAKELSYSRKDHFYNKIIYKSLDGFISIANHLTHDFKNLYNLKKAKVTTILNSIEINNNKKIFPQSIRQEFSLDKDSPIIGNISALRAQKNHETLIKAMRLVVQKIPNAILLIAGEGEDAPNLKKNVGNLGLTKSVKFLGYRSDVDNLLAQFDIFVLSSLYEGLPLCILEAMAAGKPIVATDADGTNEVVKDGETGLLVPLKQPKQFAEAILSILSNPDRAAKMGKAARKLVEEQHNMGKMISQYEEFYEKLLST